MPDNENSANDTFEAKAPVPNTDANDTVAAPKMRQTGPLDAHMQAAHANDGDDRKRSSTKAAEQYRDRGKSIYEMKGVLDKAEI